MDRAAEFTRLLEEHHDALYRYARLNCWDRSRAEDVLQDAVMSAYRSFDKFQSGTNFKAWLFRFLINTLLNENRRWRKEPDTIDPADAVEAGPPAPREKAYDLLELDERDEFLQQLSDPIKRAVEALSAPERMVFLLRTVEDFSYKEISDLLDMPPGTAMSHLHRGRSKLRERLGDYGRTHGWGDGIDVVDDPDTDPGGPADPGPSSDRAKEGRNGTEPGPAPPIARPSGDRPSGVRRRKPGTTG